MYCYDGTNRTLHNMTYKLTDLTKVCLERPWRMITVRITEVIEESQWTNTFITIHLDISFNLSQDK